MTKQKDELSIILEQLSFEDTEITKQSLQMKNVLYKSLNNNINDLQDTLNKIKGNVQKYKYVEELHDVGRALTYADRSLSKFKNIRN